MTSVVTSHVTVTCHGTPSFCVTTRSCFASDQMRVEHCLRFRSDCVFRNGVKQIEKLAGCDVNCPHPDFRFRSPAKAGKFYQENDLSPEVFFVSVS